MNTHLSEKYTYLDLQQPYNMTGKLKHIELSPIKVFIFYKYSRSFYFLIIDNWSIIIWILESKI